MFANEPQAALAKRIAGITPGGKLTKSFFTNSGTEANETAILAARCYTGSLRWWRCGTATMAGRRYGDVRLRTEAAWRLGGAPAAGFTHALNAYCYRCPLGATYPSCGVRCARDMEEMIRTSTSGRLAAFIAEPIQGVGGFITPPKEYFEIVLGIVKKFGGLFISRRSADRLGPDRREVVRHRTLRCCSGHPDQRQRPGQRHSDGADGRSTRDGGRLKGATISTFGGNPVAATAAKAVIDFIDDHHLLINAAEAGAHLRARLEELKQSLPYRRRARHGPDAGDRTGAGSRI